MDKLAQMQAFVAVVTETSFVRAAAKLNLSAQLVSKYDSALETALGVRLLNRTTRKVHLTEAGLNYYPRAQQLLQELSNLENDLAGLQQQASGILRISAPVSFAVSHMGALLTEFQRAYPKVGVDVQLNDRKVDIIEEGFDVALRIGNLTSSSLVARRIAPIHMMAAAAPEYLQRHGTPTSWEAVKQHKVMYYSYATNTPYAPAPPHALPGGTMVSNNGDLLVQCAVAGAGIAIQPTFIIGQAITSGKLVPVMCHDPLPDMALYAVYAHRALMASKLRTFIDFLSVFYGDPPPWDVPLQPYL